MEFQREDRYYVLKHKDIKAAGLTREEVDALISIASKVENYREAKGLPSFECVVVESDWSIYDIVWGLVETEAQVKARG